MNRIHLDRYNTLDSVQEIEICGFPATCTNIENCLSIKAELRQVVPLPLVPFANYVSYPCTRQKQRVIAMSNYVGISFRSFEFPISHSPSYSYVLVGE